MSNRKYTIARETNNHNVQDPFDGDLEIAFYICATIDLLGQSEAISKWNNIESKKKTEQILIVKNSLGKVLRLRKDVADFVSGFGSTELNPALLDALPLETRRLALDLNKADIHVQRFGDTVLLFAPVARDGTYQMKTIFAITASLAMIFRRYTAAKIPIRGAVDIDTGCIPENQDEIYGPALVSAHHLESKSARYPRILVGDGLIRFARIIADKPANDALSNFYRTMANDILHLIRVTEHHYPTINYFSPLLDDIFSTNTPQYNSLSLENVMAGAKSMFDQHKIGSKLYWRFLQLISDLEQLQ